LSSYSVRHISSETVARLRSMNSWLIQPPFSCSSSRQHQVKMGWPRLRRRLDHVGEGADRVLPGARGNDVLADHLTAGVQLLHGLTQGGVVDLLSISSTSSSSCSGGCGPRTEVWDAGSGLICLPGGLDDRLDVLGDRVDRGVAVREHLAHVLADVLGLPDRAAEDGHVDVGHEGLGEPEHRQCQGLAGASGGVPDREVGLLGEVGVRDRLERGRVLGADLDARELDTPESLDDRSRGSPSR
jgi:hypothetical protein